MSTPCYTRVFAIRDGRRRELCRAYRFQDGYPSGHGLELAEFLLNNRARFKHMSGGEVAPMLIAHFASAEELRLILEPVEPSRMTGGEKLDYLDGAEWEYHVLVDGHAHSIQVEVLMPDRRWRISTTRRGLLLRSSRGALAAGDEGTVGGA